MTDPKMNVIMLLLISVICIIVIAALIAVILRIKRRSGIDGLDGSEFERYCADALENAGFTHVRTTPASRDFGADVLAQKDGVTYAVQCKRYDRPVGVSSVQEVYAARDFYGMMVGAVMTNSEFTAPARQMAEKLGILLWDGQVIKKRFSQYR